MTQKEKMQRQAGIFKVYKEDNLNEAEKRLRDKYKEAEKDFQEAGKAISRLINMPTRGLASIHVSPDRDEKGNVKPRMRDTNTGEIYKDLRKAMESLDHAYRKFKDMKDTGGPREIKK